ncbi:MAG: exodeoxyribonuclease V subunit gamma, partial [Verrucomicrobia bacterium]|nr:exodeoxyribonuclease V subunit gamma [Verrucomicrobiota bacterium]
YDTRRPIEEVQLLVSAMQDECRLSGFEQNVNVSIFAAALGQRLEQETEHGRYLTRGVTFCNLLPFRGIPFKDICLLGMNDQDFPRGENPPAFDLMTVSPRLGDRSTRDDDRYMFLEAILSARERLIISYTGRDCRDNALKPPSPVLSELVEYIDRSFVLDGADEDAAEAVSAALTVIHPLQPFSSVYFSSEDPRLFSYANEYAEGLEQIASTQATRKRFAEPLEVLEPVANISLDGFCRFFSHPVRAFMNTRMNVYAENDIIQLEESEPFTLGGLDRYTLTQHALAMRRAGHSADAVYQVAHAQGLLPHGVAGDTITADVVNRVDAFLGALEALLAGRETTPLDVQCTHEGLTITGALSDVYGDQLVLPRCGRIRDTDLIDAWIRHIVANVNTPVCTTLLGTDKEGGVEQVDLDGFTQTQEACAALGAFVKAFQDGQGLPLHFFPACSLTYVREIVKGETEERAIATAGNAWWGSPFNPVPGAAEDAYNHMVFGQDSPFDETFTELALCLLTPLAQRLVSKSSKPMLKPLTK